MRKPLMLVLIILSLFVTPLVAHVGTAIAFDSLGRLYFCDTATNVVWRIELDGQLTQVATGVHTNLLTVQDDGTIAFPEGGYEPESSFTVTGPGGMSFRIDRSRIVWRRPDGSTGILAGGDERGFRDGTGAEARFNRPVGLAVDSVGNVYVTDYGNKRVRMVSPAGEVTTIARTRLLWFPVGIAVRTGRIYVVERSGNYWGPTSLLTRLPFYRRIVGHAKVREINTDGTSRVIASFASSRTRVVAALATLALVAAGLWLIKARRAHRPTLT